MDFRLLQESRLAEQKLQREVGKTRDELGRRRDRSIRRREENEQQMDAAECERQELQEELDLAMQILDLAETASETLRLEKEELEATYAPLQNEMLYLRSLVSQRQSWGSAPSERSAQLDDTQAIALPQGMVEVLREGAARQTPRQILELVDRVSPGCLVLLPSALKSADEASGFEYGERLFDYVWTLATAYRRLRLQGGPDVVAALEGSRLIPKTHEHQCLTEATEAT